MGKPVLRMKKATAAYIGAFVLLAGMFVFALSPYIVVRSITASLQERDSASLARMIDWASVHDNFRNQIARAEKAASDLSTSLPVSFTLREERTMITPENLPSIVDRLVSPPPGSQDDGPVTLSRASFKGITRFDAHISLPGRHSVPLILSLELHHMRWKIVRIVLPRAPLTLEARSAGALLLQG